MKFIIFRTKYWCSVVQVRRGKEIRHNPYGPCSFSDFSKDYWIDNVRIHYLRTCKSDYEQLKRKYTQKFLNGEK